MTEKLDTTLELNEIKQTRTKRKTIPFRDSALDKINRTTTDFGPKKYIAYNFDVSKGSSLKGLMLKFYKQTQKKSFVLSFWFNNRNDYYIVGSYPNIRCKDVEKKCLELAETHQDDRGIWIKNPNETRADEKRLIEKPDTTITAGKSINEAIEDYCKGGFEKDYKFGNRTSKSCNTWFRYMAGYNKRQSLIEFEDDDSGPAVVKFIPNKHLRIVAPKDWTDLFRKFPCGSGILKDRIYYNRRKKKTYTIPASTNKAIYDTDLGKSLIEDLKTGDIERWLKDISSYSVKEEYLKVFITLWIWARKRGWLGTNPGLCPITLETVYVKKEIRKESIYTDTAINLKELEVFHECSEELSHQFPFKAELHQLMVVTGLRKQEALKLKKSYLDFDEGVINLPKGINKQRFKDQVVYITPEVEIILRNILDMGNRPGLEFYKMKDFPWLFATRRWKQERYFDKKFRLSAKTRLGGDENFIPALRQRMREKLNDPNLLYSFKVLRKTYITLSRKQLHGRADKVKHLSRHKSEEILQSSYDKPQRAEVRDYANKTTSVLSFIKRRA